MNRIFGIIRGGAGRVGLVVVVMTATVVLALPAGANAGQVKASQDCAGWWANVTLHTGDSATLHTVTHCGDGETTTTESTTTTCPTSTTTTSTTTTSTTTTSTTTTTTMPPSVPGPVETTTSTTVADTTTTTLGDLGSTTSTGPSASTTSTTEPPATSTTLGTQGTPDQTTTSIEPGAITGQLPFTGGSLFPAIFGGACLLGGALLALRHRRTIWTLRK